MKTTMHAKLGFLTLSTSPRDSTVTYQQISPYVLFCGMGNYPEHFLHLFLLNLLSIIAICILQILFKSGKKIECLMSIRMSP